MTQTRTFPARVGITVDDLPEWDSLRDASRPMVTAYIDTVVRDASAGCAGLHVGSEADWFAFAIDADDDLAGFNADVAKAGRFRDEHAPKDVVAFALQRALREVLVSRNRRALGFVGEW